MLRVITMLTGDKYPIDYVYKLYRAVERNMSQRYRFVLVTDRPVSHFDGLDMDIITNMNIFPGWWNKLMNFTLIGECLWLDLDAVIVGPLDGLCETEAQLRIGKNWAQSGHGGCQSTVMYWREGLYRTITVPFSKAYRENPDRYPWPPKNVPQSLWGDQEYLTELRDSGLLEVDYYSERELCSYKYHCRDGLPEGVSVIAFHGKPDPHEVSDKWVKDAWK